MKTFFIAVAVPLGTCALLTLLLSLLPVPPQTTITKVNFDRVEKGMAFQDVESILGPVHSSSKNAQARRACWFRHGTGWRNTDDEGLAFIEFDRADQVIASRWTPNPHFQPLNWFDRASLHYSLARFHWPIIGMLGLLIGVGLGFAVLTLVALRDRKARLRSYPEAFVDTITLAARSTRS
jgi:hypothetical protein